MKKLLLCVVLLLCACEKAEVKTSETPPAPRRTVCQVIRDGDISSIHPESWGVYCVAEVDAKLDTILQELQSLKKGGQ